MMEVVPSYGVSLLHLLLGGAEEVAHQPAQLLLLHTPVIVHVVAGGPFRFLLFVLILHLERPSHPLLLGGGEHQPVGQEERPEVYVALTLHKKMKKKNIFDNF